jgi:hypothetical protein
LVFYPKYISCVKKIEEKKEKTKKIVQKDFIGFSCKKQNKEKLDQINSELAQM